MTSMTNEKYTRIPMDQLTQPKTGLFMVYVDYYWVVTHDGELVFFSRSGKNKYASPQCNQNEAITQRVAEHLPFTFGFDVMKLPVVFVPINPADYVS